MLSKSACVILGVCVGYASGVLAAPNEPTLRTLLKPLSKIVSILFEFRETRGSAFFKQPQISRGTLYYARPDHIIKQVTHPTAQRFEVDGQSFSRQVRDAETQVVSTQQFDLTETPALKTFTRILLDVLQNNTAALEREYVFEIEQQPAFWRLTLSPKVRMGADGISAQAFDSIIIEGNAQQLLNLHLVGAGGEYTHMQILNIIKQQREP